MKFIKVFLFFFTVAFFSFLGGIIFQMYSTGFLIHAKENHFYPEIRTKALYLVDDQNKIRGSFYLGIHDCPNLVLYDKDETNRFSFGLAPAGNPGMSFYNEKFEKLIDFSTVSSCGTLTLWDKMGGTDTQKEINCR